MTEYKYILLLMNLSKKNIFKLSIFVVLLLAIPLGMYLSKQQQDIRQRASEGEPFVPEGSLYNPTLRVLKLFGQPAITQSSRNKTTGYKTDHGPGVIVDNSSRPNKVYVVDTGNNRVLGYNGIGFCSNNQTQSCTTNSDCGTKNTCTIDGRKNADIAFGQPDLVSGACNRDNNIGVFKQPNTNTLCFLPYPLGTNTAEFQQRINIDVDSAGNVYSIDTQNNRVLKYNQPFSTNSANGKGDTEADFVWGQDTFTANFPNKGQVLYGSGIPQPDASTLHLSGLNLTGGTRGVSVDKYGNVWVADMFNNRVLRFPASSKQANLVIGQPNFTTIGCYPGIPHESLYPGGLNQLCRPTLARLHPDTEELYVLDEWPEGYHSRILVFRSPFFNGMTAYKTISVNQDVAFRNWQGSYFQSTGFVFNPYKQGEYAQGLMWVNERDAQRTVLIDDNGNILKVIGAKDKSYRGGYDQYHNPCDTHSGSVFQDFNLVWPGGSIGIDSEYNIYLSDETFSRVSRYALPYNTQMVNEVPCLPLSNGGVSPGTTHNVITPESMGGSVGTTVFQNQLIVHDIDSIKVWNNYMTKPIGAVPDFVIANGLPPRGLLNGAIDDENRLWTINGHGRLRIYQLPFTQNNQSPIADNLKFYWSDDQSEVSASGAVAFDPIQKAIYIADGRTHRVMRVKNYRDPNRLVVDMVIGQPDKNHTKCNNTHEMPWTAPPNTSRANSLCLPAAIQFDKLGNLYVIENSYECHGNNRITVFIADDLRRAQGLFPNLSAQKVFNTNDFTSVGLCAYDTVGKPGSPVSVAFNSRNQMVIGNDGYYGDKKNRHLRQLWIYTDPINKQTPDGYINIPLGASGELVVDENDNLIIQDHTWNRVWVIHPGLDPLWIKPTISSKPFVWGEAILTPTPTPISSSTPNPETSVIGLIIQYFGQSGNIAQGDQNNDGKINELDFGAAYN